MGFGRFYFFLDDVRLCKFLKRDCVYASRWGILRVCMGRFGEGRNRVEFEKVI